MDLNIIINSTAAKTSGALTILKDFMAYIYAKNCFEYHIHLLTTTKGVFNSTNNIIVHELPVQNWCSRLIWDKRGLNIWCKNNKIIPDVIVSFQNTCSKLAGTICNTRQLVYYHQPLPLVKYHWRWYSSEEWKLFLYANCYGFFVNRWNKNAEYVVQLSSVKDLFCKKFPNISVERVHVIRPNLPNISIASIPRKDIYSGKKVFIYPATPLRYKNHIVILKALEYLRQNNPEIINNIKVIFTVPNNSFVANTISEMKLELFVDCINSIPYEELLSYYKRSDALLFPSKIESFGLPLSEAALFGDSIIAADLPYAREVLEDYNGVDFIDVDDYKLWAKAITNICINEKHVKAMTRNINNSWEQFEQLMLSII